MVDLMMWLVIAALLLAAAIQGIGYYQKAALVYQMANDASNAGSVVTSYASQDSGVVTDTVLAQGISQTKTTGADTVVSDSFNGASYIRIVNPSVTDTDVVYLFNAQGNLPAGVSVIRKGTKPDGSGGGASGGGSSTSVAVFNTLTWTPRTGISSYLGAAMSGDGATILEESGDGYLYRSTDSGVSWTKLVSAPSTSWAGLAVSKDGTTFYAGSTSSPVGMYKSTDSGNTWTLIPGTSTQQWGSIAMSDDGTKLVAADSGYGGHLWVSTDSGATWVQKGNWPVGTWTSVASSADGQKLVAVQYGFNIFTSTDGGSTWVQRTFTSRSWQSVASSADGTKLIAADYGNGYIYLSTDSGVTWVQQSSLGTGSWFGVTSSTDGTKLAVVKYNGLIDVSKDSGATWASQDSMGVGNWGGISSSADGSKLIAGVTYSNKVYTGSWGQ